MTNQFLTEVVPYMSYEKKIFYCGFTNFLCLLLQINTDKLSLSHIIKVIGYDHQVQFRKTYSIYLKINIMILYKAIKNKTSREFLRTVSVED